jgi:hypothetical protein
MCRAVYKALVDLVRKLLERRIGVMDEKGSKGYKSYGLVSRFPSEEAATLMLLLEETVGVAALQQARIEEHVQKSESGFGIERTKLYADIHFYLICWDDFRKILCRLVPMVLETLGQDWGEKYENGYLVLFDSYKKARDTREHAEQRVSDLGKLGDPTRSFLGQFEMGNRTYRPTGRRTRNPPTFVPVSVSVGADSLEKLRNIFDELFDLLDKNLPKRSNHSASRVGG